MLHRTDFWAGFLLLLLGLFVIFILIPIGVVEPKKIPFAVLAPSYYPRLVAMAMIVIGLAVAVRASLPNSESRDDIGPLPLPGTIRLVSAVIIMFAVAYSLTVAGLVLGTSLAVIALLLLAGERRPLTIALIAALLPMVLYLFFTKLANIPIPGGVLDPILLRI